jgi:hypothetical protein
MKLLGYLLKEINPVTWIMIDLSALPDARYDESSRILTQLTHPRPR